MHILNEKIYLWLTKAVFLIIILTLTQNESKA